MARLLSITRTAPSRRLRLMAGGLLLLAGLLLLSGVGGYQLYAVYARSQLDELVYSSEPAAPASHQAPAAVAPPASAPSEAPQPPSASPSQGRSAAPPQNGTSEQTAPAELSEGAFATLYPGLALHPKYWDSPLMAGSDPYVPGDAGLPEGYRPVTEADVVPWAQRPPARRIRIPAIGVDAQVKELAIVDLGDSRAYETPKNVVGHIPETANPGEVGNAWYFGHLESPIRGEGNVFFRLPEIPGLLKNGDRVYVFLETEETEYVYQVTATDVVYQDDLSLYDSDVPTVTLVACVPRLVYDHRLVVTARLVGVRG